MTPSRETNSSTITFLMTEFLRVLSDLLKFAGPRFPMSFCQKLGTSPLQNPSFRIAARITRLLVKSR
jgi:hypothetical protein